MSAGRSAARAADLAGAAARTARAAARRASRTRGRQRASAGTYVVEFAIVLMIFLTFTVGVMEMARLMYVFNTLQEVTRRAARAAATADFSDAAAMASVRQAAIFRSTAGGLILAAPVTDAHIRIDYLALTQSSPSVSTLTPIASGALPASPARNRLNCMSDPNGAACISFVRVRLCDPGDTDTCQPVTYAPLFSIIALPITMPASVTVVKAETLGYAPGKPL